MEDKTLLGQIDTQLEEGVAIITFSHPAHNSLPGRLLAQLRDAIRQAGTNTECRVIILKSGGNRTFCAGASFDELMAISDFAAGKEFFLGFAQVINALRECPKFVIGSVQGKTIGGGVGLAAATDYCLATTFAAVKLSELAIGIGPFVVGPAVARKVGQSAFQQLAINATAFQTAEWAREKGLFAEVFPNIEELDAAVLKLAQQLAQSSPEAMKELKRISWEGTENWNELLDTRAAISGELVLSDFTRNAIAAFKNK
ncbi:MAG: enoyl-CoA hydratase/isomerase family protein [Lewinella sp.]|jgi:methylglutaconyl-CoA hydratase|uniref:enoyl-CoA hydratase/isomerase family protein n=1 Tax=Lewinella sp. TaxID=2004506 RepID=UPI003D6BB675